MRKTVIFSIFHSGCVLQILFSHMALLAVVHVICEQILELFNFIEYARKMVGASTLTSSNRFIITYY